MKNVTCIFLQKVSAFATENENIILKEGFTVSITLVFWRSRLRGFNVYSNTGIKWSAID